MSISCGFKLVYLSRVVLHGLVSDYSILFEVIGQVQQAHRCNLLLEES